MDTMLEDIENKSAVGVEAPSVTPRCVSRKIRRRTPSLTSTEYTTGSGMCTRLGHSPADTLTRSEKCAYEGICWMI